MKISPITRMLLEYLSEVKETDTVTYEALTNVAGYDCRPGGQGYSYLLTAIKRLEHEGINFENEPKIGYRRLIPEETPEQVRRLQILAGRQAKRHETKVINLPLDRLSHAAKVEQAAAIFVARVTKRVFSVRAREKLIAELRDKTDPIKAIDYEKLTASYLRSKA